MKSIQKNYRKSILWFFLAFCCICACTIFANVYIKANADVKSSESTASTLFLPSSYEQYLELQSPTDVAFSMGHIAIADGETLYVFDRAENRYNETKLTDGNTVAKLGFADERLFVAVTGVSNFFYEYDYANNSLKQFPTINCSTFLIEGDTLYTATVSNSTTTVASHKISALESGTQQAVILGSLNTNVTPSLAFLDGTLYCAVGGQVYCPDLTKQFGANSFYLSSDDPLKAESVKSVCAYDGKLCYTAQGGLYASDLTVHRSSLLLAGEGFGALTSYNNTLYAVSGKSIRAISINEGSATFTGYEISSTSASVNRLCGAVDTARAGGLLVTADAGNRRVTVYDFASDTYSEILPPDVAAEFSPRFVATDGNIIAAATERAIYTCTYTGEAQMQFTAAETSGDNTVRGIACVYGAVYYVTGNSYGKVGGETVFHDGFGSPAALASDVYGDLYVAYDNHSVVRFTEREFISQYGGVQLDFTLPEDYKSLRADFEGNLYYLRGGSLYCNGNDEAHATVRGKDFVYTTPDPDPLSFALGFEDDEVFFLYGSYLVKSDADAIDIPTLNEIPADGVREAVFTVHAAEGLLVEIPAGTIGIRTDLDALKAEDPAYFPYSSYYRTSEAKLGVLLGVKDGYALVVLYEIGESDRVYTANLFRFDPESGEGLLPTEQYWTPETEPPVRYLSSTVGAYDFPCMHEALRETPFERGAKVLVEGYVTLDAEHVYALVCGTSRTETRGYVPASYLTEVPVSEEQGASFEPAYLKENREGTLFTADDGTTITVTERTRAEFYANPDGTYTARIVKDGKEYRATVSESAIDRGESDALRISLIIILSVLALIIIGVYFFTLPRKRKDT